MMSINTCTVIILPTKVLNLNILDATVHPNRFFFYKLYIILGVVNHDHSYMCEENPEPVDMSTQTDLTGEGIEILQRQTREMKSKLVNKKALMRHCLF